MVEVMRNSIIVIDNFYDNPEEVREEALSMDYLDGGTYPGKDSRTNNFDRAMIEKISRIVGAPIIARGSGNYRLSLEGDTASRHIHTDAVDYYVANISLTRNEDVKGGLALWKHKETGLERSAPSDHLSVEQCGMTLREVEQNIILKDGLDESKWEQTTLIPYRFNRCIIIDGRNFHSPWPQGFGDSAENGRLSQHFFFISI